MLKSAIQTADPREGTYTKIDECTGSKPALHGTGQNMKSAADNSETDEVHLTRFAVDAGI